MAQSAVVVSCENGNKHSVQKRRGIYSFLNTNVLLGDSVMNENCVK
jgi:hypothetical protein